MAQQIQLFLNECIKHSSISKLELMTGKTGYLLALDFSTLSSVNRDVMLDLTCMFGAILVK